MHDLIVHEGPQRVELRLAKQDDLLVLARIHKAAYSRSHFTALLPEHTLATYYGHFLTDGAEITLAVRSDEVVGFAVYGTRLPARIASFKKAAIYDIFMTSIRNPVIASYKLLNSLLTRFTAKQVFGTANFLLLSIAVVKPGQGVGGKLLTHLSHAAQQRGESVVGLYVNADNINAINAYISAGFVMCQHIGGQFYMEKHNDK